MTRHSPECSSSFLPSRACFYLPCTKGLVCVGDSPSSAYNAPDSRKCITNLSASQPFFSRGVAVSGKANFLGGVNSRLRITQPRKYHFALLFRMFPFRFILFGYIIPCVRYIFKLFRGLAIIQYHLRNVQLRHRSHYGVKSINFTP